MKILIKFYQFILRLLVWEVNGQPATVLNTPMDNLSGAEFDKLVHKGNFIVHNLRFEDRTITVLSVIIDPNYNLNDSPKILKETMDRLLK